MDIYAAIQERHGFALPPAYRELVATGLFDPWGRPDWRDLDGPARVALLWERAAAGRSLYLPNVEWYPPDELRDFAPGTWTPGLLPFAGNGAGDHWCWYLPWATADTVPVVFYDHEMWQGTGFAPDFRAALFRLLLEACAAFTDDPPAPLTINTLLQAYTTALHSYLPTAWLAVLTDLSTRPATRNADGHWALLDQAELQTLIADHLGFARLGEEFQA